LGSTSHYSLWREKIEAVRARQKLQKLGVDINGIMNGVALPNGFHRRMHTNEYYDHIKKLSEEWKTKRDAINDLRGLALHLLKEAKKGGY